MLLMHPQDRQGLGGESLQGRLCAIHRILGKQSHRLIVGHTLVGYISLIESRAGLLAQLIETD